MVWVWDVANVYFLVMSVHRTARCSAFAVAIARQKLLDDDEARIPESFGKRSLGHVYVSSPSSPAELIDMAINCVERGTSGHVHG